ncbi:MAG: hypothetical protein SVM79_02370 [Chloroflexota bacterium]|nr:hypothetical protein [Chloroflexota bacterium]
MDPTQQYLLLIFGGCLGTYQIGAAAGRFKGIWFFRTKLLTYIGGFAILGATYIWFFTFGDVQMNSDPNNPEVEGFQQLYFFLLGALLSLIVTFLISSLTNFRGIDSDEEPVIGKGLDDLKSRTVFQAFTFRWKNRRKNE